jgi:glucokinase
MLLAGDIGGTKTALAIFSPDEGPHAPLAEEAFPSARYPSLEALASEFLAQTDLPVTAQASASPARWQAARPRPRIFPGRWTRHV